ncbi:MAG: RNA polymerase sporulation sigma factor SigK [Clostridia bacterium]|nr:RNA polymerase sporulation sigma factor SigK [Clostridia bacterium]MBQ3549872.1 RNA polymerase sporulation sigma factor SigK [Clostridia bacterium]
MFLSLLMKVFPNLLFMFLHAASGGSFPKALSSKAEAELLQQMADGDDLARKKLIEHNLRLVAHVAKKYFGSGADQDDLVSIGTVGLIKAVSSFKPDKGIRLATYAARCIDNEILMYFRAAKKAAQDVYISDPIDTDKDGNTLTLIDVITDNSDIVEDLDLKLKLKKLQEYLKDTLTPRELTIIRLRYGLDGKSELPQREVAKKLKISRSYVSRIEKKALEKLRARFDG